MAEQYIIDEKQEMRDKHVVDNEYRAKRERKERKKNYDVEYKSYMYVAIYLILHYFHQDNED